MPRASGLSCCVLRGSSQATDAPLPHPGPPDRRLALVQTAKPWGGGGPLRTRADHPHVSFLSLLPPAPQIRLPWRSPPSPCERRASQEHRVGSKISMGGIEISRSRVGQHEWSTDCVRRAFARLFEPTSRHNTSHHKEEGGSLEDGMDRRRI